MANSAQPQTNSWTPTQAYVLAVICLVVGIALGYFIRGSASPAATTPTQATQTAGQGPMSPGRLQDVPQQQPAEAAKAAVAPLLEQLKSDPNNYDKLIEVANLYYDHSVYPEAIQYYQRALKVKGTDPNVLTDMATAMFYNGDAQGSIPVFEQALKYDPKHVNALFNMGIVKWQGLKDPKGAVAAWERLLKENPNFEGKAKVQEYIERAKAHSQM